MTRKLNKNKIFSQKAADLTFIVMFFLIFSVFVFFAIRPSLITAFSLKKEEQDLKRLNESYEKKIIELINIQSQTESVRDRLYLFEQAVAKKPNLNKIINDLNNLSFFNTEKIAISEIDLTQTKNTEIKKISISLSGSDSFDNILKLIQEIINQRRLKTIPSISIGNSSNSSDSGKLKVDLSIEAYYL